MGRYNTEQWTWVKGYENLYQVSTVGRVRSVTRTVHLKDGRIQVRQGVILSPGEWVSSSGKTYLIVSLWKGGKGRTHKIHQLVATAFIPNPNELPEVNHKDTNPSNNRVKNLEWCDHDGNMKHARESGVMKHLTRNHAAGSRNGNSVLTEDSVAVIKRRVLTESCSSVAADYGVSYQTVCNIKAGRIWKSVVPSTN